MKHTMRRVSRFAILVVAGILCCSYAVSAGEKVFEQAYPLAPGGKFVLENINGSVMVDGWDKNTVEVRAVKKSDRAAVDPDQVRIDVESDNGKSVMVHTRYPQGETGNVAVEYHIYVPNQILLSGIGTVNGSVLVRGVTGSGDLHSVIGDVEVLNSAGRFSAHTTNGDLRMELQALDGIAPMDIETVNGSVKLGLPSNAAADLKATTLNGNISSELSEITASTPGSMHQLEAKLGIGGGEILIRTINGAIHLVKEPARM